MHTAAVYMMMPVITPVVKLESVTINVAKSRIIAIVSKVIRSPCFGLIDALEYASGIFLGSIKQATTSNIRHNILTPIPMFEITSSVIPVRIGTNPIRKKTSNKT